MLIVHFNFEPDAISDSEPDTGAKNHNQHRRHPEPDFEPDPSLTPSLI